MQKYPVKILLSLILLVMVILVIIPLIIKDQKYYPVSISVEIKNDHNDIIQIFYNTGNGFNKENTITRQYSGFANFDTIAVELPPKKIHQIRIDPATKSPWIEIRNIRIKTGKQTLNFDAGKILSSFRLVNLSRIDTVNMDSLKLQLTGNQDAQLIYLGKLDQLVVHEEPLTGLRFWLLISGMVTIIFILVFYEKLRILAVSFNLELCNLFNFVLTKKKIWDYLNTNGVLIAYSFILTFLAFGYPLFNFSLSVDEEMVSFSKAHEVTEFLTVGRWGIYLINHVFNPQSVLPYYPTLLALISLSVFAIILMSSENGSLVSKLVFTTIFVTHPIHSYYLAFNTSGFYYAMGMIIVALSYLLFRSAVNRKSFINLPLLASAFLITLSLSIYQSLLTFFVLLALFYYFNQIVDDEFRINKFKVFIAKLLTVAGLGVLVYYAADKFFRYQFLGPSLSQNYKYLEHFVRWGTDPVHPIVNNLLKYFVDYLFNIGNLPVTAGITSSMMVVVIPVMIYLAASAAQNLKTAIMSLAFLILMILVPFSIMFYSGSLLPLRSMIALPLLVALFFRFCYQNLRRPLAYMLALIVIMGFFSNLYINTRLFYAGYTSWQADRDMANRIAERVYNLDPPRFKGSIKVIFIGHHQYKENALFYKSEVHGASFFEWDDCANFRVAALFRTIGVNDFTILPDEDFPEMAKTADTVAVWPFKGSVCLIDDIVLVNLGN